MIEINLTDLTRSGDKLPAGQLRRLAGDGRGDHLDAPAGPVAVGAGDRD